MTRRRRGRRPQDARRAWQRREPSRCFVRARSRRVRHAPARRALRCRCILSRRSKKSACSRVRGRVPAWAVYHSSDVPRVTLIDFFTDLSVTRGEFLVHDDGFRRRAFSYPEVAAAARGLAARLYENGIRKGDAVVIWSENRPEWIVAFWACVLGGVVVVPIDYRASPDFLARVARIVRARLVLIGQDVPPLTSSIDAAMWRLQEIDWHDGRPPDVTLTGDDIAEIIFTSGATAEPKGV